MRRYTENCPRWWTWSISRNQKKSSRRTSPICFGAVKNLTVLFRSASLALRTLSPSLRGARLLMGLQVRLGRGIRPQQFQRGRDFLLPDAQELLLLVHESLRRV